MNPPTHCEEHKHVETGCRSNPSSATKCCFTVSKSNSGRSNFPQLKLIYMFRNHIEIERQQDGKKKSSKQHISTLVLTAWLPLHQILNKSFLGTVWTQLQKKKKNHTHKHAHIRTRAHKHGHTECLVVLIKQQLSLLFCSRAGIRQCGSLSCGFPVEQNTRASTSTNTVRPPSRPFTTQPLRTCCPKDAFQWVIKSPLYCPCLSTESLCLFFSMEHWTHQIEVMGR